MRIYILILFFVVGSAAKCSESNKPKDIPEILLKLNTSGRKWVSLWGYSQVTSKDIKQAAIQSITINMLEDSINVPDFFKVYSDSSKQSYVDIYSGTFYSDSINAHVTYFSEPESIVKLWRNDSLQILLHYGYTIVFQDAFWIDKNAFMVVGYEIAEDNLDIPKIWFFDLPTKKLSTFVLNKRKKINDDYLINRVNQKIENNFR